MIILIPAVLSTKQCHDYVGGSLIWKELQKHHSDRIKPLRTLPRGDAHYLRKTVDEVLMFAHASGTLVRQSNEEESTEDATSDGSLPVLKKTGRRFKPEKHGHAQ